MNPVSYDMAEYLEGQGLGVLAGNAEPESGSEWGIYVNFIPPTPVHCIAVIETPSPPPTTPINRHITGTNPLDRCFFQVQVRSDSDKECWDKIVEVSKVLNGLYAYDVAESGLASVSYKSVLRRSDFLPISQGLADLFVRTVNFTATRQEATQESGS